MSHLTSSTLLTSSFSAGLLSQDRSKPGKTTLSSDDKLKLLKKELKDARQEQKARKIAWADEQKQTGSKTKGHVTGKADNRLLSSSTLYKSSLTKSKNETDTLGRTSLSKTRTGSAQRSKSPAAKKAKSSVRTELGSFGVQANRGSGLSTTSSLLSTSLSTKLNVGSSFATSSNFTSLSSFSTTRSSLTSKSSKLSDVSSKFSGLKLSLDLGPKITTSQQSSLVTSSLSTKGSLFSQEPRYGAIGSHLGPCLSTSRPSYSLTSSNLTTFSKLEFASNKKPKSAASGLKNKSQTRLSKKSTTKAGVKRSHSEIEAPEYELKEGPEVKEVEIPSFVPPEQDLAILKLQMPVHDVMAMKNGLINAVSASLIRAPDFKDSKDPFRIELLAVVERVSLYDSEFILKLALYTRNELNIRTTANFLLACASNIRTCRPFLRKYYNTSIRLPSDWIDVAEQYQAFHDGHIRFGSLPAALRRVMVGKFPSFDKYQLAKYNKENSAKKKRKAANKAAERGGRGRGRGQGRGMRGRGGRGGGRGYSGTIDEPGSDSALSDSEDEEETTREAVKRQVSAISSETENEEEVARLSFTLKQLIRKLHITEPVEHVMCLIGKRYPSDLEEFYKSRLPDTFEEERAGKRMKLPTPETWETQVSMKGNKATTWQDLIDHKKLPFMAMLRNLRNMIKAGVSDKHHNWVLKKLTDEGAVVNSRQFPFRFFSAYEVLNQLEEEYNKNQTDIIQVATDRAEGNDVRGQGRGGRGRGARGRGARGRGGKGRGGVNAETGLPDEVKYDVALLNRYRKALDQSVKIATLHNVKPIRGNTVIFVNLGSEMNVACTAARGLGSPRQVCEVGTLLGLMCKYSCEECKMVVYGNKTELEVELEKGTILTNMSSVLGLQGIVDSCNLDESAKLSESRFTALLRDRTQVDNLIILSTGMGKDSEEGKMLKDFLCKYRRVVNPNLLFVSVNLSGRATGLDSSVQPGHDNDVHIAGYSDQILRFIAERGDSGQLVHVENMDKAYSLKPLPSFAFEKPDKNEPPKMAPEKPLPVASFTPRWRTARVFISSTFRDMHGERDLLTRFVFPELRARAAKMFINVFEVDLRWGVTEEMARTNQTLELCLSEVKKCQFFIGLLGQRYGWVPEKYQVPDTPEFDWVKEYPKGASVTELEMHSGALCQPDESRFRAFFYFRDDGFMSNVPAEFMDDFISEDSQAKEKMSALKRRIVATGLQEYQGYPCKWGGVNQGRPLVTELEELGNMMLDNLWEAISNKYNYKAENSTLDEWSHTTLQHEAYMESHQNNFVGRKKQLASCFQVVKEHSEGGHLVAVVGKPGSGKTAVLASFVKEYVLKNPGSGLSVLTHFIGAAPGSTNIIATLRRLNHEICRRFTLEHKVAEEYKNIVPQFEEVLAEAGKDMVGYPLLVVIDGMDLMEDLHQAQNMQWIPQNIPKNVIIMVSVQENGTCHRALAKRKPLVIEVGTLDMWDKAEVVRSTLSQHRKQLSETPFNNQMKLITAKKEATNPFYLKLACEEMRVYGLFEKINTKLKSLPHTVPQLLQEILNRLEYDHGESIVGSALALLACSRSGLHEADLHSLLSYSQMLEWKPMIFIKDIMNIQLGPDQMLPQSVFAQLLRALQGFLIPNSGHESSVLVLSHKEVTTAILKRYITSIDHEKSMHQLLAGHFWRRADPNRTEKWDGRNKAAFAQLPYHLACGGCYQMLEAVLCDLRFLRSKCILGMSHDLAEDFLARGLSSYKAAERESQKFQKKQKVQSFQKFISSNLHILATHPALLWQQALNEPEGSLPQESVVSLLDEETGGAARLVEVLNKPRQTNPCVYTVSNMPQLVTCLAVSRDNTTLAAGSKDCMVHLYDLDTGKETLTLTGHSDQVTSVCFVGRDKLCSASADTTLSLWDLIDGHRVKVMKGHSRHVGSCSANSKAEFIVSAGWDRKLKVWKGTGEFAYDLRGDHSPMNCVAWHPDDSLVAVGAWDCAIRIWDVFNKTRKAVLRGHSSAVRDVAFSPSGRHIASAALDGEVKLWASSNGAQVGTLSGHALPINRLAFSPSGHELITVSDDHKVKVWSGHLGQLIGEMGQEVDGAVVSVALHPEGEQVAVGYHEGFIRVYDITSGLLEFEVHHHNASVRALTYDKTSTEEDNGSGVYYRLFSGSDDCTIKMLSGTTGEVLLGFSGHTKSILSITVTSMFIISTSEDISTCLYKITYPYKATTVVKPAYTLRGHEGPVTSSAVNSSQNMLVTASRDMSLMFWDLSDLSQPHKVIKTAHMDWINGCSWSDTNDFLVTCSNDFTLKLWDTKTYTEKLQMTGHMSAVNSVAYSCGCIVSCSCEGVVKVWSHKGTEITTLHGHTQRVNACDIRVEFTRKQAISEPETSDWATMAEEEEWQNKHDKTKLDKKDVVVNDVIVASCSDDGTLRLWRPREGNELCCLTGHSDRVSCVTATNKGQICTGALDHTLKVWQPEVTAEGQQAKGHKGEVSALASKDSGETVLTGSRDGAVKVWLSRDPASPSDCVYTFSAHRRAVTGLCFVGGDGQFASCSEDSTVKIWKIVPNKSSWVVKLQKVIAVGTVPLTGIHYYNGLLLTTDWAGVVKSVRVKQGKVINQTKKVRDDHWVLCSVLTDSGLMYYGGTLAEQQPMTLNLQHFTKTSSPVTPVSLPAISYQGDGHLSPYKRQVNWLTAVDAEGTMLVFGDVNGQLTVMEGTMLKTTKQVHSGGITDVALTEDFIFSASKDGTLKVWDHHINQIGQYFAPSPVTRLSVISRHSNSDVTLMTGDLLGNITFLKWRANSADPILPTYMLHMTSAMQDLD